MSIKHPASSIISPKPFSRLPLSSSLLRFESVQDQSKNIIIEHDEIRPSAGLQRAFFFFGKFRISIVHGIATHCLFDGNFSLRRPAFGMPVGSPVL